MHSSHLLSVTYRFSRILLGILVAIILSLTTLNITSPHITSLNPVNMDTLSQQNLFQLQLAKPVHARVLMHPNEKYATQSLDGEALNVRLGRVLVLTTLGAIVFMILMVVPELGVALYLYNGVFKNAPIFGDPNAFYPTIILLSSTIGVYLFHVPLIFNSSPKSKLLLGCLALFNGYILLSAFSTPYAADKAMRLTFFIAASVILAFLCTRRYRRLLRMFRAIALIGILMSIMSLTIFLQGNAGIVGSVTLFGANDVLYGRAAALGIVMILGLLLYDRALPSSLRWLYLWMLPVTLLTLILSTSRGAVVGLVATLLFTLLMNRKRLSRRRRRQLTRWIWLAVILGWPIATLILSIWGEQVMGLWAFSVLWGGPIDLSTKTRLELYQEAALTFIRHPILGIGIQGNLSEYPHNIFLEVAKELGIVGLSLFGLLLWQLFQKMRYLLIVSTHGIPYTVANLIAIGLVYAMTTTQFSGNLQHQRMFWLFAALCWGMEIVFKQERTMSLT